MTEDVDSLGLEDRAAVMRCLVLFEGGVGVYETHERILEGHEDHHDAEDLEGVAGHVHHDTGHGKTFDRRKGDLPGLLKLERVHLFGGRWFARRGLGVLLLLQKRMLDMSGGPRMDFPRHNLPWNPNLQSRNPGDLGRR